MSDLFGDRRSCGRLPLGAFLASVIALACVPNASAVESVLVAVGAEWAYFKGTQEPPPDWNEVDFDDSAWERGPTGIGYGDNDDATVLADMQNGYLSVFARHRFEVASVPAVTTLVLRINYDDGFVAYINGTEVARAGLSGLPPTFDEAATSHEVGTVEEFLVLGPQGVLVPGENVIAIQGHNTTLGSSDFSIIPELVSNPQLCPTGFTCLVNRLDGSVTLSWTNRAAEYDSIAIRRNGELLSADIGGALSTFIDSTPPSGAVTYQMTATELGGEPCAPLECTVQIVSPDDVLSAEGTLWRFFRGFTAPPLDWTLDDFDDSTWEEGPVGIGYGDNDDMTVLADMQNGYLAVFCRLTFEIEDVNRVERLVLNVRYDDGFVAYVNGEEVGREGMPLGDATELTAATAAIEPTDAVAIDILPDVLSNGDNVLAVSVHNGTLGSSDLTFIPTLLRVPNLSPVFRFRRGDADSSGGIPTLTDAVRILNFLFRGGERPACGDAADTDDTGDISISDGISLLNALFRGGNPPPAPGFECGPDPTPDAQGECATPECAA